ncbi:MULTISPECIES: DUF2190 family protein [Methylosinus]|uniref:DUF2190 domain-containing protein n=1 Tax=Methylosinus trichosporium (strain ATCC 35070 / NCIMB 11131 / UNIQEM 75 / OB3b) TaxID=595536 RepID=A0A2D2CYR3_METT3|nr:MULTISPECIES: DUF2190 family protein [Methylosinus]ATQ67866.1 DUF2190 domain-containing protein [Methylosinus trichosporium OB3b]OBS50713.1 hypothetical protein A8B73_20165 [Methylosinus sp. 3S-1]
MKNFVQLAEIVTVTAPSGGVASGDPVLIGALFGVASKSAAAGESVEIMTEGGFDLAKHAGDTFSVGDKVYFNASEKKLTSAAPSNPRIGVAMKAAVGSATSVLVRLNGLPIS